jgi:hypothetical protein
MRNIVVIIVCVIVCIIVCIIVHIPIQSFDLFLGKGYLSMRLCNVVEEEVVIHQQVLELFELMIDVSGGSVAKELRVGLSSSGGICCEKSTRRNIQ